MTLAAYITANFAQVKSQLGWSDSLQIVAITDKTLEWYGVSTEAEATNTKKLHAIADLAVWRQALNDVSLDYDFSADNASFKRSQQREMIEKNMQAAETDALVYLPNYSILINASDDHPDWTE
jgi:hypothetical protein